MADIYITMTKALQDHWKAHNNAYPLRFELDAQTNKELVEGRRMVITTMNFKFEPGWETEFQGCDIVVVNDGNFLVDKDGNRVPLAL
ncbi:MAG: hypothetical protein LBE51_20945 [Acidovorax sp.]|jgi:hypothetical protein|uniref:hypothetical protein n=1 Tax=Comamonas sp. TaxID=34028 RepID=UPI002826A788|nr:hypothetical protein [Comamonas sp.]MDR0212530.1 hypothetical protein [Comamonas sp.]MDR2327856.1 hypothetical protein [Acidovorax sp.]